MSYSMGIDLGTTFSCVAVMSEGSTEVLENGIGKKTTPSWICFDDDNILIGQEAKNKLPFTPDRIVYDAKRLIGRRFNDVTVQEDMKVWPFKVVEGPKEIPQIEMQFKGETKRYFPEYISALVLTKLKNIAQKKLGSKANKAVITVPAYFNNEQRERTKIAGQIAGLEVLSIISEPVAAAIKYGFDARLNDSTILVYDLGGGTLDVTIIQTRMKNFKVLAKTGDTHLGGEDFDRELIKWCLEDIRKTHGIDMSNDKHALGSLRIACENAKINLTMSTKTTIEADLPNGIMYKKTISQATFDDICAEWYDKCVEPISECLEQAKINAEDITDIILVGGSTRIKAIQDMVSDFFKGARPIFGVNPDEAVAAGAAIYAAKLQKEFEEGGFIDVMGFEDITPMALGIGCIDDKMKFVIPRGSPLGENHKYTGTVYTIHENQHTIRVPVLEGDHPRQSQNHLLDEYVITVKENLPDHSPIEGMFYTDSCGILHVQTKMLATGQTNGISIKPDKHVHSGEDIKRMKREAKEYVEESEDYEKRQELLNEILMISVNEAYSHQRKNDAALGLVAETQKWADNNRHASIGVLEAKRDEVKRRIGKL